MTDREMLIRLLCEGIHKTGVCEYQQWHDCDICTGDSGHCTVIADHLIANGVTMPKSQQKESLR